MSSLAISVENLGKCYKIQHQAHRGVKNYRTLGETLSSALTAPFRKLTSTLRPPTSDPRPSTSDLRPPTSSSSTEDFWALRDVSFEIKKGEIFGVIGRNGAGKSTLLKLLSRITEPTKGRIELNGRVSSLLEVGTGFHPELTGRENIYLNGAILGMPRLEIRKKFEEIVEFAEVERFLDTPVKRYSSGMYVRLAFAVAAHLEPEILIVDEVLAVGDAAFQKKCLGKMKDVASGEGRTVLFVSHNLSSIRQLCDKAIVLDKGMLRANCSIEDAVAFYVGRSKSSGDVTFKPDRTKPSITKIAVDQDELKHGNLVLEISYESPFELKPCTPGIALTSGSGVAVFGSNSRFHPPSVDCISSKKGIARLSVKDLPIEPGTYYLSVYLGDWHLDYDRKIDVVSIVFKEGNRSAIRPSPEFIGYLEWPGHWAFEVT